MRDTIELVKNRANYFKNRGKKVVEDPYFKLAEDDPNLLNWVNKYREWRDSEPSRWNIRKHKQWEKSQPI